MMGTRSVNNSVPIIKTNIQINKNYKLVKNAF
jgi:hypothetical protein